MRLTFHPFDHGHYHIPQSISTQVSRALQADHPVMLAFLSIGAAIATYQLFARLSPDGVLLAALAGTSSLLLLGVAIESSSLTKSLLTLLAAPLVFALAYTSLSGPDSFLIAAFAVQSITAANQIFDANKTLAKVMLCATLFYTSLALLLF